MAIMITGQTCEAKVRAQSPNSTEFATPNASPNYSAKSCGRFCKCYLVFYLKGFTIVVAPL